MKRGQKLNISSPKRITSFLALVFATVPTFAQMAPATHSDAGNIIPSCGGRPELLTVFDMQRDTDAADRLLAESAQGLMNSEPLRTDKIYLVFSNQDKAWLDWLVQRQYVLSTGTMQSMEELLRRWPSQDALLCDDTAPDVAAAVAGCERLLVVSDPKLIKRFHYNVKMDLRGKWKNTDEAHRWLLDNYGDQLNTRIVALQNFEDKQDNMVDYQVANKMFTFSLSGGDEDRPTLDMLRTKFDANIPCLFASRGTDIQREADAINRTAKFMIPVAGLSNLSVWTTFRPFEKGVDEINSGAVAQPRAMYDGPNGLPMGGWVGPDNRPEKERMPWLRELAPPVYENWARQRNGGIVADRDEFRMGIVNDQEYAKDFGDDRERIWNRYLDLCRDALDRASGR